MRTLVVAALLLAGCSAPACPGNCCFGMHTYTSSKTCDSCSAKEVPTEHRYCVTCAGKLKRCPHCGGKRAALRPPNIPSPPVAAPSAKKAPTPEIESPPTAPPQPANPVPPPSSPPPATSVEEETAIIRRSTHQDPELLKAFPVALDMKRQAALPVMVFVSTPERVAEAVKHRVEETGASRIANMPEKGEAMLYILGSGWKADLIESVTLDRARRRIRVPLPKWSQDTLRTPPPPSEVVSGFGVQVGPLANGSWRVELTVSDAEFKTFVFLVGPGVSMKPVKRKLETDLEAFLITWPEEESVHPLKAFVCRESEMEAVRNGKEPAPFTETDELILCVSWGRRLPWPDASADFDARFSTIKVHALWTGSGFMKSTRFATAASYGFKLGKRPAGDYAVEISETTAAHPDRTTIVKRLSFSVGR